MPKSEFELETTSPSRSGNAPRHWIGASYLVFVSCVFAIPTEAILQGVVDIVRSDSPVTVVTSQWEIVLLITAFRILIMFVSLGFQYTGPGMTSMHFWIVLAAVFNYAVLSWLSRPPGALPSFGVTPGRPVVAPAAQSRSTALSEKDHS